MILVFVHFVDFNISLICSSGSRYNVNVDQIYSQFGLGSSEKTEDTSTDPSDLMYSPSHE